jgi:3-hydroxyacyl-CoA dehydrogenase
MGAQIAAHFANAGVPALLLDISADAAAAGLKRARALKPDPFFTPDTWKLITTGALDEHLSASRPRAAGAVSISDADWIIEAVVERLDIKRELLARVDAVRRVDAIVSSNTSAISIAALAEGRSQSFREHWLGTHFFNPPRYLRLLELIPTAATRPEVLETVRAFADHRLGKGVVIAKDSPGFIGNHVALYGMMLVLGKVASGEFSIEEADAITGPPLGRPKSATFRTLDLAGLDIVANVVRDLRERLPGAEARDMFVLPEFVERMLERGLTGEKAGGGFYKRVRNQTGDSEILVLDPQTLDYRPQNKPRFASIETALTSTNVADRVRTLFTAKDRAGEFVRATLPPAIRYAARVAPAVAHSSDDVDRVMRWGFGWELGPFELAQALEFDDVPHVREGVLPAAAADLLLLRAAKEASRTVRSNAGASLVDLGDGVLCVEFHSKMNAIGADTMQMVQLGVREASRNFAALVVGNEGEHFSAGANLMLMLLEAQDENWDEIDVMIRTFQQTTAALRFSSVPVIVAPAGLTLGGGCEMVLHADRVQAAAESYIGLVETGVGLIPAGGGTKEMTARAVESLPAGTTDLLPVIQRAFETIAFATTSTSGPDARRLGYLRPVDGITMNRERLIADARTHALARVNEGYQPAVPRTAIRVGGDTVLSALKLGIHLAWRAGRISDYDALIGRKLATIMSGGELPHQATVSEQHLLDLEREAFLSLLGERKTQERIQFTLKTGKPLRN